MKNEQSITDRLRALSVIPAGSQVVLGIGDDCAIYRPRGSAEDLLFTTDMLVEGTHFLRETHKASDVARKTLARGLSDIASMGGSPRFCLVSLCTGKWTTPAWVNGFCRTLAGETNRTGALLVGGDLSHGEILACDIVLCGAVPRGTALRRDGARPGNEIFVSGALGGSTLGLRVGKGKGWRRHLKPQPRLALGAFLREKLHATAAMDVSDGLSLDLRRLCLASGVTAAITDPPVFPGATAKEALHGGEEYELLFTVRAGAKVPAAFEGLPLTRIGSIGKAAPGQAGTVFHNGAPLAALGYDHFRR